MKRARIAIAVAVLAGATAVGLLSTRKKPEAPTPVLLVEPRTAAPVEEGSKERAMALVVASLSPEERARAIEIMSYASARLEARATSLVVDFGDDIDPMVELQKALSPYLPSITAARALERGHFLGSDFVVTPAASCAPASSCIATWKPVAAAREPEIAERARFAAWPIAYATVAEFANVAARDNAARSLRATTISPTALHALVLTSDNLALAPSDQHEELEAAAKRLGIAMDVNNLHESAQLEGLARPAPPGRVAPWLTLSETELLVVPRLSNVARATELRAAIEHAGGPVVRYRGLATADSRPAPRP